MITLFPGVAYPLLVELPPLYEFYAPAEMVSSCTALVGNSASPGDAIKLSPVDMNLASPSPNSC